MDQKKKALFLTAVVAVILTLGLTAGFSPSVSLRDRILDVVQLPRKVFSYILGEHPTSHEGEAPSEEAVTGAEVVDNRAEPAPQSPAAPQNGAQEPPAVGESVTTPIDFFTEDDPIDLTQPTTPAAPEDSSEVPDPEEQPPSQTPNLPVNQLPDNILE